MYTVGSAGVAFYIPEIVLWFFKKSRQDNIFFGLPDALDLMVVCVEAGLGLDQAMRKVSEEMKKTYAVIAEEFSLCNLQLQMGRARNDVLHELGARTGVDDLKALAAILIQADKFGSSVAQALRVQSDSMRTRRRQMAEEKAAKTAVKLIFPLVLFIFPAIFIVLVGPAAHHDGQRNVPSHERPQITAHASLLLSRSRRSRAPTAPHALRRLQFSPLAPPPCCAIRRLYAAFRGFPFCAFS